MNTSQASPKVAVIGGGLAGMSAAIQLRNIGLEVELFEARSRLGGRAGSFVDTATGQTVDYCQHVGMGCCTYLIDFLEKTETLPQWQRHSTLHFYGPKGEYVPLSATSYLPAPLHLNSLLSRWPGLTLRNRIEVAKAIWKMMRLNPSRSLDERSALEFLNTSGQSQSTIDHFWSTIMVSALGEQIDRVALGPMRKVIVDGFLINRHAYEVLVPTRPLRKIFSEDTTTKLQQQGITIHTNRSLKRLNFDQERCLSATFSDGKTYSADHFILAIPWYQLDSLSHSDTPQAFRQIVSRAVELQASPITGIHLWWDRNWLPTPHAAIVGRLSQWVFRSPWLEEVDSSLNHVTETASEENASFSKGHHYQVVISASRELPRGNSDELIRLVTQDLCELFPTARTARLLHAKAVTDPQSVFSVTTDSPSRRPDSSILAAHNLSLAGDWTNTGWPATMEGAIRSGFNAAQACSQLLLRSQISAPTNLPPGPLARWLIR